MGVMCFVCKKSFSTQTNLNKHTKNVHGQKSHPVTYDVSKWNFKCLENGCNNSFQHNEGLTNHLSEHHGLKIDNETLEYSSKEDFFAWKAAMEKKEKSYYVVSRTSRSKDQKLTYYTCNRSGKVRSKCVKNKRLPKSQGSCKINKNCTSCIKVTEHDNKLKVIWVRTHYGHTPELQHIRLPETVKSAVASQLMLGVPASRILNSFRDTLPSDISGPDQLDRKDILTRKDISNIKKSYHINITEGNKDENERQKNIELVDKLEVLKEKISRKIALTMTKFDMNKNGFNENKMFQIENQLDLINKLLDSPCDIITNSSIPIKTEPANTKISNEEILLIIVE